MALTKKLIVAVVSGKGGVGKTLVSTAIGYEFSKVHRTLIVDLDFFNRGLSGLLGARDKRKVEEIEPPAEFVDQSLEEKNWTVSQVQDNIFTLEYPDLSAEHLLKFQSSEVEKLKEQLEELVDKATDACDAEVVVLDCHGGPDNTSFAACTIADCSVLVSEPERITFYGTLHFLRQAEKAIGNEDTNIHLLFNKVGKDFSGSFLQRLYDEDIQKFFGPKPLLGMIPFEEYLTNEFGKTTFLTSVFPYSFLTQKIKIALTDLLGPQAQSYLSKEATTYPPFTKYIRRLWTGRLPIFANPSIILPVILATGFIVGILSLWESTLELHGSPYAPSEASGEDLSLTSSSFLVFSILWFLILKISRWMVKRDHMTTYTARSEQHARLAWRTFYISSVLFLLGLLFPVTANIVIFNYPDTSHLPSLAAYVVAGANIVTLTAFLVLYLWQISRCAWTLKFKFSFPETVYRVIACASLAASFILGIYISSLSLSL